LAELEEKIHEQELDSIIKALRLGKMYASLWVDLKRNLHQVGLPNTGPEGFVKIFRETLDELRHTEDILNSILISSDKIDLKSVLKIKNLEQRIHNFRTNLGSG